MTKDKFTIKTKNYVTESYENYIFSAVDVEGKDIFGADAAISRHKDIQTLKFKPWKINYGTSGSGTYQKKLPYVTAINKAMEKLKELEGVK